MSNLLVSILTVSYNSATTIARTIESVLHQTYAPIEYLIIDGASTDETVSVARSYQAQFDAMQGRTMTIISEPDKGMYDALNKGARLAHGELVGQINADDWYEPNAVETMVQFYQKTHYDVAWGDVRIHKPTGEMIKHARIPKSWTSNGWCHPAMFSQRKVLLQYPYACESMYDDFDFYITVRQAGKHLEVLDSIISNFSFGGMSNKKSIKDVKKRINLSKALYQKHGLSHWYTFQRFGIEMAKYLLG